MSIFDKLDSRLDNGKPEGISPLDIAELPRSQRQIMFFLMRDQRAATDGINLDTLRQQFASETEARLAEALAELSHAGWLTLFGEAPDVHYKVNLRRKRGAQLNGVWSFVMDRIDKVSDKSTTDPAGTPTDPNAPLSDKEKSDQVWDYVSSKLSDAPAQKPSLWNFDF